MIYRVEYQHYCRPNVWTHWADVEGLDEVRFEKRQAEKAMYTIAVRVLKQTWVPVDLEGER